jgi:ribosome-associated heat shock protein Hsp15
VDSWIWSVRLAKTRSAAPGTCRAGHIRVNGMRVKPAHSVVVRVIAKRAGAPVAAECYVDRSPPPPSREETATVAARDRGTGRPAKRERRSTGKLPWRPADRG